MVSVSTLRCNQFRENFVVVFLDLGAAVPLISYSNGQIKVSGL